MHTRHNNNTIQHSHRYIHIYFGSVSVSDVCLLHGPSAQPKWTTNLLGFVYYENNFLVKTVSSISTFTSIGLFGPLLFYNAHTILCCEYFPNTNTHTISDSALRTSLRLSQIRQSVSQLDLNFDLHPLAILPYLDDDVCPAGCGCCCSMIITRTRTHTNIVSCTSNCIAVCVCVCVCGCAKATWPYYASQILPRMMNSVYLDLGKIYNITMKMLNQMWQVDVCCQVRCCSICYSHFTAVGIQWWSINSQKERDPKAMEEAFTTPPVAVGIAASGDLFFFPKASGTTS